MAAVDFTGTDITLTVGGVVWRLGDDEIREWLDAETLLAFCIRLEMEALVVAEHITLEDAYGRVSASFLDWPEAEALREIEIGLGLDDVDPWVPWGNFELRRNLREQFDALTRD